MKATAACGAMVVLAALVWLGQLHPAAAQVASDPRPVLVIPYYVPYEYWYGPPYWYPYYPYRYYPPVFVPAETLYGPGPVMRMMGVGHWFQSGGSSTSGSGGSGMLRERPAPAPREVVPRQAAKPVGPPLAPESAVIQAWKYIGNGDAAFAAADYHRANQRYAQAIKAAPTVVEAWLRQGLAQTALGNYELAVAAIRESLELKPDLPKGRFRIWELFNDDQQAARRYVEALVKKAEENPKDANLAFLAGVHLYFDEQPKQAERYINRAIEAGLADRPFVRAFLPLKQPEADNPRGHEF